MRWEGQAFWSVLPKGHGSIAPCLGNACSLTFVGGWIASITCILLLWGLMPSLVSMYLGILFPVRRMLTFPRWLLSPCREGAWVPLQVFWDGPQGCSQRCRGDCLIKLAHTPGLQLAPTFYFEKCLENTCDTHRKSLVGIFTPRKDDGKDSGCIGVQSNGVITHSQI